MMDDYNELNLYFEDREDDETVDLWVYTDYNEYFIIRDVNRNPVHYKGWWTISFIQYHKTATAHIEGSKVVYFVVTEKDKENGI